jgi:hypothetical protein
MSHFYYYIGFQRTRLNVIFLESAELYKKRKKCLYSFAKVDIVPKLTLWMPFNKSQGGFFG